MAGAILTLNAGSSSLKLALFDVGASGALTIVAHGEVEGIGDAPHFVARAPDGAVIGERRWPTGQARSHEDLLPGVLEFVDQHLSAHTLGAVGHRVVHGGAKHAEPALVTDVLLGELEALAPLAPLHQPHNLAPMRVIARIRPGLPQVACFDTSFHHGMPTVATRFALPRDYEREGVRRYGFHGLSYEYIAGRLPEVAPAVSRARVIVAHLGNGASMCAMRDGKSVDTTMGLTALDGLMMGTRCGNLDPGVVLYLQQRHCLDAQAIEDLLYHRSGLLGVSGLSGDMRVLTASDDARAREAIELFVYRIARETGALVSSLGGLDTLVFTAGIGEHAPIIRAAVCQRLAWLGARLDADANARGARTISAPDSAIAILVMPTDEELMIARHTSRIARQDARAA